MNQKTPSPTEPSIAISDSVEPKNNLSDYSNYLNRELSFIAFNERVLTQSLRSLHPLLERLKFLIIFSRNADEFYEIRVAGLMERIAFDREKISLDGLDSRATLDKISQRMHDLVDRQYDIFNQNLLPALEQEGIFFLRRNHWTKQIQHWATTYFENEVLPLVSPVAIDPAHPFPRLANKSLNFIVELEGKDAFGRDLSYAIVPAPRTLPRVVKLPEDILQKKQHHAFVFLSSIIHANTQEFFPGLTIKGCYQFRITRNADLDVDVEGAADLANTLRGELHSRRFGVATRLEVSDDCPQNLVEHLLEQCQLAETSLFRVKGPVNVARLFDVIPLIDRPDLSFAEFTPRIGKGLKGNSNMFSRVQRSDLLLHHPYESFQPVLDFLTQAANDPDVVAIKQTLYRTGKNSPVVDALCAAARNGKEVTAVVELRARFDEEANLQLASRLQEAGALVVYGVVGFKTHTKMILVLRREAGGLVRYVHMGTGNYHPGNARLYTDYSLFTRRESITVDVQGIFHQLTSMGRAPQLSAILQAPFSMKRSLLALIDHEIGAHKEHGGGRIIIKCNGLTESKIIQALYRASQAGVVITLVVRGMCCLRPGVPGLSESIRVISVIDRFLEHTRVFYFYHASPHVYLASADLMERNLNYRIETAVPLLGSGVAKRVLKELEIYIDTQFAHWELDPDGSYHLKNPNSASPQKALLDALAVSAG